jgi:hypothetical protein
VAEEQSRETAQDTFALLLDWGEAYDAPRAHVNQFLGQVGVPLADGTPDGVWLVLGSVSPPIVVGADPEARQRQIDALKGTARVTVHGRFQMSRARLDELIGVLQETAANYDSASNAAKEHAPARGE